MTRTHFLPACLALPRFTLLNHALPLACGVLPFPLAHAPPLHIARMTFPIDCCVPCPTAYCATRTSSAMCLWLVPIIPCPSPPSPLGPCLYSPYDPCSCYSRRVLYLPCAHVVPVTVTCATLAYIPILFYYPFLLCLPCVCVTDLGLPCQAFLPLYHYSLRFAFCACPVQDRFCAFVILGCDMLPHVPFCLVFPLTLPPSPPVPL